MGPQHMGSVHCQHPHESPQGHGTHTATITDSSTAFAGDTGSSQICLGSVSGEKGASCIGECSSIIDSRPGCAAASTIILAMLIPVALPCCAEKSACVSLNLCNYPKKMCAISWQFARKTNTELQETSTKEYHTVASECG